MLSEVETLLHADKNLAFRCVAFINITYFISIFIKKFKTKRVYLVHYVDVDF